MKVEMKKCMSMDKHEPKNYPLPYLKLEPYITSLVKT